MEAFGFGSMEEFEEAIRRFGKKDHSPKSSNPADYPRAAKIEDLQVLTNMLELDQKRVEWSRLHDETELRTHEIMALRRRIFLALEKQHPEVCCGRKGGTGWRVYQGATYFVGWDTDDD